MIRRCIVVAALTGAIATASASPRTDPTNGRAVFTGAATSGPTAVSLNPAALGEGKRDELYATFTAVLDQLGVDRQRVDAELDALVDGPDASDLELGPGGSLGVISHRGDRLTLGGELRIRPPEMFPDDTALGYHALGSRQRNYALTVGIGFKLASSISIGLGVGYDVTQLRLRYLRDTAADAGPLLDCDGAPCGFENPAAAQTYDINVHSDPVSTENLVLNAGVLVRLWPGAWLGLAYHSTPGFGIQTQLDGNVHVTRAPREGGGTLAADSTVFVSYPARVDGELRARVLPEVDLHVGGRWEDLSRMQAYDVRAYGRVLRGENVPEWTLRPRGFRDAFAAWAGVEQVDIGKPFVFGGRLGIESSALPPDRTAPGSVSPTSLTLDAGVQWRFATAFVLQLSYGVQVFQRVHATTSDYDPRYATDCAATGFDYTSRACEAVRTGYAIPTAAGDYGLIQHALRLALRYERI